MGSGVVRMAHLKKVALCGIVLSLFQRYGNYTKRKTSNKSKRSKAGH